MPTTWSYSVCAVIAAIAVLASGCGSGDASAESLPKAQFTRKADAICERANEAQLAAIGNAIGSGREVNGAKHELALVLPPVQREVEEISELGAPIGDEKEIASIVEGLEEAIAKAEEDPTYGIETAFTAVDKRAVKYGLPHCAGLIIGGAK